MRGRGEGFEKVEGDEEKGDVGCLVFRSFALCGILVGISVLYLTAVMFGLFLCGYLKLASVSKTDRYMDGC